MQQSVNGYSILGRLSMLLLAALATVVGAVVMGSALGVVRGPKFDWAQTMTRLGTVGEDVTSTVGAVVLGILGLILGLVLLSAFFRGSSQKEEWIGVSRGSRGERYLGAQVEISARSMRSLVRYVAEHQPGIVSAESDVHLGTDGWYVTVILVVDAGAPLADVVRDLRLALTQQMYEHTAWPVTSLKVRCNPQFFGGKPRRAM